MSAPLVQSAENTQTGPFGRMNDFSSLETLKNPLEREPFGEMKTFPQKCRTVLKNVLCSIQPRRSCKYVFKNDEGRT